MRVTVYYFAVLRERAGQREQSIERASSMPVGTLYRQLFPEGEHGFLPVMFAVNQEYVAVSYTHLTLPTKA